MTFVALPGAAQAAQPLPPEMLVYNDGFFPDIDPVAVRDAARIPTTIPTARLRAAIVGAIMTVANDLTTFVTSAAAAGYQTLADVPAPQIDGQSVQIHRYNRAVALYAKAELIERYPDFDTTQAGGAQAEDQANAIAGLRRDAQFALRDLKGRLRTTVELI